MACWTVLVAPESGSWMEADAIPWWSHGSGHPSLCGWWYPVLLACGGGCPTSLRLSRAAWERVLGSPLLWWGDWGSLPCHVSPCSFLCAGRILWLFKLKNCYHTLGENYSSMDLCAFFPLFLVLEFTVLVILLDISGREKGLVITDRRAFHEPQSSRVHQTFLSPHISSKLVPHPFPI